MVLDNVFFHGRVLQDGEEKGKVIDRLNRRLKKEAMERDPKMSISTLIIADGVTLVHKLR